MTQRYEEGMAHPKLKGAKDHEEKGQPILKYELRADGLLLITLNRSKVMNAMNDWVYLGLAELLQEASSNEDCVGVIIVGSGKFFSAGQDLRSSNELRVGRGSAFEPVGIFMRVVIKFDKLLIGVVNGPAIGIGFTLLLHCDIVYSCKEAYFMTPFSRIALIPEFCSSVLMPKILGPSIANEMLLLSKSHSAEKMKELGMIADLFPQDQVLERSLASIREGLQFPLAGRSIKLYKKMIKKMDEDMLVQVFFNEMEELDQRIRNGEPAQAIAWFLEHGKKGDSGSAASL